MGEKQRGFSIQGNQAKLFCLLIYLCFAQKGLLMLVLYSLMGSQQPFIKVSGKVRMPLNSKPMLQWAVVLGENFGMNMWCCGMPSLDTPLIVSVHHRPSSLTHLPCTVASSSIALKKPPTISSSTPSQYPSTNLTFLGESGRKETLEFFNSWKFLQFSLKSPSSSVSYLVLRGGSPLKHPVMTHSLALLYKMIKPLSTPPNLS